MMSSVKLYKNIGLDPTFKKTIDFISKTKQIEWFNSKTYDLFDNVNYNKLQNTLKINTDVDFSTALQYTYCVIEELETTNNRRYFCFIDSVSLISVGVIEFNLVLDPIQTFMCEFTLGECMVNRKHVNRWFGKNSNHVKYPFPQPESTMGQQQYSIAKPIPKSNYALCCIVFTSPIFSTSTTPTIEYKNTVLYGIFPVDMNNRDSRYTTSINITEQIDDGSPTTKNFIAHFPSYNDVIEGTFTNQLNVPSDAILSFTINEYSSLEMIHSPSDDTVYLIDGYHNNFSYTLSDAGKKFTVNEISMMPVGDLKEAGTSELETLVMQIVTADMFVSIEPSVFTINTDKPVKPTTDSNASYIHEPALFMEPYVNRYILDGKGRALIKIPDNQWIGYDDTVVRYTTLFNSGGMSNYFQIGTPPDDYLPSLASQGCACEDMSPMLDIVSNQWHDYVLTQRTADRELINNQNWQNAIDNVIFMGYGGSLVASRGASGTDSTQKRQQNIMTGVKSAIGLSVGASVITSVIDSHFAWDNQKIKEVVIKNKPGNIVSQGIGIQSINGDYNDYYIVETSIDSESMLIAYERFMKYGYTINRFETPDIRSRKYFDYILTDGCIIEGSLNTVIKQEIAMIFDSGITIFHGDYTNTLEYPTYENIERTLM